MQWLILGVGLLIGTTLLARGFANADPRKLARTVRWVGIILVGLAAVALVVSGRLGLVLWLLPLLLPFIVRWRMQMNRAKAAAGPAPGQTSNVETAYLRMWLDHDSGAMDGEVLSSRFQGQQLGQLSRGELLELREELRSADPQSQALVEAFLDRAFPDWRDGRDEGAARHDYYAPPSASGDMSVEQALEVLGLQPGAGEAEIREAHRRLMLRNHPDQGGSTYIAAQINRAKDLLLEHSRSRT